MSGEICGHEFCVRNVCKGSLAPFRCDSWPDSRDAWPDSFLRKYGTASLQLSLLRFSRLKAHFPSGCSMTGFGRIWPDKPQWSRFKTIPSFHRPLHGPAQFAQKHRFQPTRKCLSLPVEQTVPRPRNAGAGIPNSPHSRTMLNVPRPIRSISWFR